MTLDEIRAEARPFPMWTLDGVNTAACFFCAGFLGYNAEVHLLDTYATVLGFDTDAEKVAQMRELYPGRFIFAVKDAYEALDSLKGRKFDLVTVDPPMGLMHECFERLEDWRALGKHLVLGVNDNLARSARCAGAVEVMPRASEGSWWAAW